jgi:Cytochrome P450
MTLARASIRDSLRAGLSVLAPMLAQGVIRRRPRMVRLVQRFDLERRSNRTLERLRHRYGEGPLVLAVPGRSVALVLSGEHVRRLLAESPEPFAVDTAEKRAALSHFQPHGVIVTRGPLRQHRRAFNDEVLGHHPVEATVAKIRDEVARMPSSGLLDWEGFGAVFSRIVRRVTLGDAARDDERLTAELDQLRDRANWASLRPHDEGLRRRFQSRVDSYVARAEPGSLAGLVAGTHAAPHVDAGGQIPHWLFAFDAAAMTAFRTLAVLASRPAQPAIDVPYLMACVQETLRLWPTTLTILRESTEPTVWDGSTLPPETSFVIISGYFHRRRGDAFEPERWLDGSAEQDWSLAPFSHGPGRCPGRDLVLLVTATVLAELLRDRQVSAPEPLGERLPATLDHESLRLRLSPAHATLRG